MDLSDCTQRLNTLPPMVWSAGRKSLVFSMIDPAAMFPETLSRILTKMSKAGLIRLEGTRGIHILDYKGLEDLSGGETHLH